MIIITYNINIMSEQPPSPQKTPRTPRKRTRAPAPAGDQISASIGENVKGVAVGKNIFQSTVIIGTLKVPVAPFLVLIVLVVALGLFFGLRLLGPDHMTGSFNLAVADFGQVDASGKVTASDRGKQISQRLYEGLKIELDSLSPADRANFQPQVWQDSLDVTQKRVSIGLIPGDTPQARETAACALAKQINANVVIYGNLPPDGSTTPFIPEFALCDNTALRVDADELVGAHQLIDGLPAQLLSQMGRPDTDLAVNIKLNSWTGALALFSIGIMYDLQGQSNLALGVFQQARQQLNSSAGSGGEVLFFFIGREELTLASPTVSPESATHLANAQAAFEQALKINPAYARAHIGLGGVFYSRALTQVPAERLKNPDLDNALKEYQAALAGASASAGALIEPKARLSLATTWILQGEAQRDSDQMPQATDSFNQAVQASTAAIQPLVDARQYRVLAQAYLTLGEAYHELGHLSLLKNDPQSGREAFTKAAQNYELCIQQKDAAITDQTLADKIVAGLCIPNKKAVEDALDGLK
jgi:tetratricopeptide (TPR) repeat protein